MNFIDLCTILILLLSFQHVHGLDLDTKNANHVLNLQNLHLPELQEHEKNIIVHMDLSSKNVAVLNHELVGEKHDNATTVHFWLKVNCTQNLAIMLNLVRFQSSNGGLLRVEYNELVQQVQNDVQVKSLNSELTNSCQVHIIAQQNIDFTLVATVYSKAEDEGRCPRMMYNCGNNACILRRQVCDGVSNCFNGSDENCLFNWDTRKVGALITLLCCLYILFVTVFFLVCKCFQKRRVTTSGTTINASGKIPVDKHIQMCRVNNAFQYK